MLRLSRSLGLPTVLPDVLGFALRVPGERPVDLLLSSTGRGRWTRLVPVLRRDAATSYCSIMAYRSALGPVRLAALPEGTGVPSDPDPLADAVARRGLGFTLAAALEGGEWEPFARLRVGDPARALDPELHLDAVLNAPPGLPADGPMARFRRPAYAAARRVRAAAARDDRARSRVQHDRA